MDAVLMNCDCMASVGAATQLYVIRTSICHSRLFEESNPWILGIKKENDVGLTDLVRD
jgi:hypothetical protein